MLEISAVDDTRVDRGDSSFAVDQESRGQHVHAAVKTAGMAIAHQDPIVDLKFCDERLDYGPALLVHGNADHGKSLARVFGLQIVQPGDFTGTGGAPSGPEIQRDHFAGVIGKVNLSAAAVFQGEVWSESELVIRLGIRDSGVRRRATTPPEAAQKNGSRQRGR